MSRPNQFGWQRAAACKGVPSYIFFPDETLLPEFEEVEEYRGKTANDFCNHCPVSNICEEFSVLHDTEGIWGGLNDRQRKNRYPKEEREEKRENQKILGKYNNLYGHS